MVRLRRIFSLALALLGLSAWFLNLNPAGRAAAVGAAIGSWKRGAPMLHRRSAHSVGGTGVGGPVLEVERFDGKQWVDESRLPSGGLNAPASVALDRRIYVIGGFEGLGNR